jgi:uncharacterized protein (DUF488 family)
MIYTLGYDHMTPQVLVAVLDALGIEKLIDVRSVPQSRRPGFGQLQLRALLNERYDWKGNTLGGRGGGANRAGFEYLASVPKRRRVCLMCKEEAPGDCHRHFSIATGLLAHYNIECVHIFRNELILASQLQGALNRGDHTYEYEDAPWAPALAPGLPVQPVKPSLF